MKLERTISKIKSVDKESMKLAKDRQDTLTKPPGSLGMLEELSIRVAGIQAKALPEIKHKAVITMAGDHGVVDEGVSAYPREVTSQMVYNFIRGGAGINVLARHMGARIIVVDMGVAADLNLEDGEAFRSKKIAYGTDNFIKGPAMSREDAVRSIEVGIEVVEGEVNKGLDILATGDMGIGNTTPSSAIVAAITGREVRRVTGRGTGIGDAAFEDKVRIIERGLKVNKSNPADALDVLSKVGGFEIGGLAGVILAGAANRIPVVLDGFISGAAALIAYTLTPQVKDYMFAAHQSVEVGHVAILEHIGLRPLLDLNLRLGEGTGATLGIFVVEAGVKILREMATFAEADVSESEDKGG
ncbi:MAG: nicotinate-nucleotide--dimethylbenzimidazole phosphoribosyltransferase [Candidatus Hydrothermarchaeota archaeon]|nr:nicotinate-nucleotide--dimethylbenzimidazole phosphoribosyltransferase [Candidatus Hydrothermarchaeota archaeon]